MTADPSFTTHADGRVSFRFKNFETGADFGVDIDCPIDSRLHERQPELAERHRAWATEFGLMPSPERFERYCATRFDTLIGYQYHGWSLEAAVIASHLMTWFFVFDDNLDMDHDLDAAAKRYTLELAHRHIELLHGARARPNEPNIIRAFDDFLRQVRELAGTRREAWYARMVHHLEEYVYGTLWEGTVGPTTAQRANTAMYMQVRHMAVGVAPCHDLMAIAADIDADPIRADLFVRRLERLAINYSIWINDLAGLNRDQKRGLANVVFTIQKDHTITLEQAAAMVGRMCDGELHAFFQMEQQLPLLCEGWPRDRAPILAYDDVLRRWMRGLLDWSARSERYQRLEVDMSLQSEVTIREASRRAALCAESAG